MILSSRAKNIVDKLSSYLLIGSVIAGFGALSLTVYIWPLALLVPTMAAVGWRYTGFLSRLLKINREDFGFYMWLTMVIMLIPALVAVITLMCLLIQNISIGFILAQNPLFLTVGLTGLVVAGVAMIVSNKLDHWLENMESESQKSNQSEPNLGSLSEALAKIPEPCLPVVKAVRAHSFPDDRVVLVEGFPPLKADQFPKDPIVVVDGPVRLAVRSAEAVYAECNFPR